jgi:predicted transcriptional regulator
MILHDTKTLSKIIRKCAGKKWFTSRRGQVEYKYRFVSVCDADGWDNKLYTIKVNIEVEITKSPYLHRSWYSSIEARENKSIRSDFYYQDNDELRSLLKLFSCDPHRLVIKSIKRKK